MKHWLGSRMAVATKTAVLGIALAGLATPILAATTISALVHFTKVDNEYALVQEMYARFQEKHPDITINWDYLDHDTYHTKLQALAVSGNLPDMMTLWPGKRTGYITDRGYALNLHDWAIRDLSESHKDFFLGAQGPDGQIYEASVPSVTYTNVVYVNDKLMTELGLTYPKTLEEMEAQAAKITAAGYLPMVFGDESSWVMQSCMLSMVVGRVGGVEWFDKARRGDGASFTDPQFVNSLKVISDMTAAGLISQSEPTTKREQALAHFVSGKAVYFVGGAWEVNNLETSLAEDMKSQVSMHAFPEIAGEVVAGSTAGALATGYGINAKASPEAAAAAWEWIKFYADPANADIMVKHGLLPTYKNRDISDLVTGALNQARLKFGESIETVTAVIDDKMDAEGVNEIINAGLQELILGTTTPEDLAAKYETWVAANDSNRKK